MHIKKSNTFFGFLFFWIFFFLKIFWEGGGEGCSKSILKRVQLTDVLRVSVKRPFLKSFNTTFMINIKNCKKKLITFFFSYKKFLKIFSKPMPLVHPLTFPY